MERRRRGSHGDALQVFDQVGDGILGVPVGIGEADEVGDAIIAEEAGDLALTQPVGGGRPMFWQTIPQCGAQAVMEYALATGGPAHPLLFQQTQSGRA